ncbi:MAG: tyrosine-type recombinase/integrase [Acidimicrobiales bacterium]
MARSRRLGYGEGSIYQQADGRWRGEFRLGTNRRRVSAWTRGEVVQKLDELRAQSEAGLPLGSDIRLGEWLDWYMEMIAGEKNYSTRHNCQWAITQLKPLRGRRLRELDVLEFERLLKELANRAPGVAAKKRRGGREKPLSKSSLNRIKMVLGAALHEAERRGLVARNIARLAHLPSGAQGIQPRRSLTTEEAGRLVEAVRGTDDEALIRVALTMGLRPGEVTGLPWAAVDLDEATLSVRQALKRLPDGTYVIGPPKVDSYRTLRLPLDLIALLRTHRHAQRKARLSAPVWEDHGLVFTNAIGRPIDSSNLRRTVATYAHLANVGHLSPNELRHSAASLLVATGTPLQDVSDMLGHRDIRMLAQTYRHKIRSVVDVTAGQERMLLR